MSAPTSLDGGALARELARRVPRQRPPGTDRRSARRGPDRRGSDPFTVLARAHDVLCTQAVDPSEIAAGLESAGVSDRQARQDFGVASVFELAERLHTSVPRRPAEVAPAADPWDQPVTRSLVRGLLFASPGLLYALALGLLPAGGGLQVLVGVTVLSSALGQGVSLLAHVLLGRRETGACGLVLRTALVGGAACGAAGVALAALTGLVPPATAALAAAQLLYLLAATALLVAGADLLLLGLLAPGVLLAGAHLAGTGAAPRAALLVALSLTLAAVLAAAWRTVPRPGGVAGAAAALRAGDGRLTALHAGHGAVSAGLLAFPVLDLLTGRAPAHPHAVALVMLPLVLSLGVADRLVHLMRSGAWAALQECTSPAAFRIRTERLLLGAAGSYAAALGALTAGVVLGAGGGRLLALDAAACGLLGVALLLGGLLVSLGRADLALLAGGLALAVDTALRPLLADRVGDGWAAAHHVVVMGALLLALLPAARQELGTVTRHR